MRKVFKNGNSLLTPSKKIKSININQKFAQMVDEFINEHEDVLKELSNR